MSRVSENKYLHEWAAKLTMDNSTTTYNEAVCLQLNFISMTLLDISHSLAVIADNYPDDRSKEEKFAEFLRERAEKETKDETDRRTDDAGPVLHG